MVYLLTLASLLGSKFVYANKNTTSTTTTTTNNNNNRISKHPTSDFSPQDIQIQNSPSKMEKRNI